jgi:hypothetical protein
MNTNLSAEYDSVQCWAPIFEGGAFEDGEERSFISTDLEDLKNIANAHRNKPIVVNHKDIESSSDIYGYIVDTLVNNEGFTDSNNNYHEPDFAIWGKILFFKDKENIEKLMYQKQWGFSNQYSILQAEGGFEKNGVKYGRLIKNINVDNVAIVETPRYGITKKIFKNSLDNKNKPVTIDNCEGNINKLNMTDNTKSRFTKTINDFVNKVFSNSSEEVEKEISKEPVEKKENAIKVTKNSFVKLNEEDVKAIDFVKVVKNALIKKNQEEEANAKHYLNENDKYEIEGKKLSLNEMKEIYQNAIKANEDKTKEDEAKENEDKEAEDDVKENEEEVEKKEDVKENEEEDDVKTLIIEEEEEEEGEKANEENKPETKENKKTNDKSVKNVTKTNSAQVSKEQFLNFTEQIESLTVAKEGKQLTFNEIVIIK